MNPLFVWYPESASCKKARQWLCDNRIPFNERHITDQNPTFEEITCWYKKSKQPLKKFFNTGSKLYRDLGLKNMLDEMTEDEQLKLLASNGALLKRPMMLIGTTVLVGFSENRWNELLHY